MSLAVIGCTVVDVILPQVPRLPAWPRHTEFTPDNLVLLGAAPLVTIGGNGANAACAAAAHGAEVTLHTSVGRDALGRLARDWLAAAGCRVRTPAARSTALNVTAAHRRQRRATFFYPGAPFALPRTLAAGTSHALVCGWPHPPLPEIARQFAAWRRRGIATALDPGPWLGRPWRLAEARAALAETDLLLTNAYELATLTGAESPTTAIARLREAFAGDLVVKRGAAGAWLVRRGGVRVERVPAPRVRAINTVGAGDTCNGTLLAALAAGTDWPRALRLAVAAASRMVASPQGVGGLVPRRAGA